MAYYLLYWISNVHVATLPLVISLSLIYFFVDVNKLDVVQLEMNVGVLSFSSANKTPFKVFLNLQWNGSDYEIL